MSIGVYIRPWNGNFYIELAKRAFSNTNVISISEFKGQRGIWLGEVLYKKEHFPNLIFNYEEMMDIYLRCRYLRSLSIEKAFLIINKMSNYIDSLFIKYKFSYFLGHLIDNYTLDIIERISKKRGVLFISVVGHFINGYSRISSRGELNYLRSEIEEEEITSVMSKLTENSYKPNFDLNKEKSKIDGIKFYYRAKMKNIFFSFKKNIIGDKLNYHYNTLGFQGIPIKSVINTDIEKMFTKISDISFKPDTVYLPLHYTPESTVDYWCDSSNYALYENSLMNFINSSSKGLDFLLKEHPAMYMKRNNSFYEKLVQHKNVKLIHPYENSNLILNKVENVFVYTGSVGIEALLRGKNVFSITENYYTNLHPNIKIRTKLSENDLNKKIIQYDNRTFIGDLLKGLMPAKFVNSKKIEDSEMEKLVYYIKQYVQGKV